MKNIKPFTATLGMISLLFVLGCGTNSNFDEIYSLIEQKNFFQARNVYDKSKNGIALKYRLFIEAVLDNSFNSVNSSKKKVSMLEESGFGFPDSLQLSILDLKLDNAVKLYDYKQAKETAKYIVANYKELVDSNELKSYQNNFAMWAALEHIEKQRIKPAKSTRLKMKKDLAGLSTLSTFIQNDSIDFIFDTGATLSTTTREIAERFNMTIFPATVDIGTITGSKVKANLAVCEKLNLGGNEFFNVVFIV
ncbi:MAG: aspartyl protease family protein, partial [Bacteroidota bacterium]